MIRYLDKIISLRNLRSGSIRGQVATMLVFFMVVILVFIMVTANVGDMSLKTTSLANAVDSAGLTLASQLGTRSRVLWNALGNDTKYCKKRGLLAFIGSILFGPLGGAIGGLIDGSGFWEGFTMGFEISLSLAGAILAGAPLGGIGMIVFAVIDISAEIYNYHRKDSDMCDAMKEIARNLSQLDTAAQFRESAYLRVLSQVVDNPNMLHDTSDIDNDGNREELVSEFEQQWFDRTQQLAQDAAEIKFQVMNFINGPLVHYAGYFQQQIAAGGPLSRAEFTGVDGILVQVARAVEESGQEDLNYWRPGEPERYCAPGELSDWCEDRPTHDPLDRLTATFTSIIAVRDELVQTIEGGDLNRLAEQWDEWIGVFYFEPGDLLNFEGDEGAALTEDPPEDGAEVGGFYYELDSLINCGSDSMYVCDEDYVDMLEWIDDLIHDREQLRTCHTWEEVDIWGWAPNPNPPPPRIWTVIDTEWQCIGDAFVDDTVCNDPCMIYGGFEGIVGTVDDVLDDNPDEFREAIIALIDIINHMNDFRMEIAGPDGNGGVYGALRRASDALAASETDFAYGDHIRYEWEDSQGVHSVEVDVDFPMPYVYEDKDWKEVCLKLANGIGIAKIEAIRKDPASQQVGILGRWNPFSGGEHPGIKRVSRSRYHFNALPEMRGIR